MSHLTTDPSLKLPQQAPPTSDTDLATMTALISQVDLFKSVPVEELETLCRTVQPRRYGAGDRIFNEGESGDTVYIVRDGVVKITIQNGADEKQISTCYEGDVVGELALLDGRPRSASAVAGSPVEMLVIQRSDFLAFLMARPAVMLALLDTLTRRARRLSDLVEGNIEWLGKVARGEYEHGTGFALRLAPAMFKVSEPRPLLRRSALEKLDSAENAAKRPSERVSAGGNLFFAASAALIARDADKDARPAKDDRDS